MTADTRVEPAPVAPEMEMLEAFLDYHRDTLHQKVAGLDEEQLRRKLVPSLTTLLGIVKHLAYVERRWFQWGFAGEDVSRGPERGWDTEWSFDPGETAAEVLAFYDAQVARSREIVAGANPDDMAKRGPQSLRWIMIHMIEETARHNGHADILREQIDGAVGE